MFNRIRSVSLSFNFQSHLSCMLSNIFFSFLRLVHLLCLQSFGYAEVVGGIDFPLFPCIITRGYYFISFIHLISMLGYNLINLIFFCRFQDLNLNFHNKEVYLVNYWCWLPKFFEDYP